jgi:hypothetical protein
MDFSDRDIKPLKAQANTGRPERQTRGYHKDGNETNFDTDRCIGSSGRSDLQDPGEAR